MLRSLTFAFRSAGRSQCGCVGNLLCAKSSFSTTSSSAAASAPLVSSPGKAKGKARSKGAGLDARFRTLLSPPSTSKKSAGGKSELSLSQRYRHNNRPNAHIYRVDSDVLKFYKSHFGGLLHVPRGYVMPKDDPNIPEKWRGFPIYKEANRWRTLMAKRTLHRDDMVTLSKMGFVWSNKSAQYLARLYEMYCFKEAYGHTRIPVVFVVPRGSTDWPQPFWGSKLGGATAEMRRPKRMAFKEFKENTERSGVGIDLVPRITVRNYERLVTALKAYRHIHGPKEILTTFRVPNTDEWPIEARGMKLGGTVRNLYWKKIYRTHADELRSLGIKFHEDSDSLKETAKSGEEV